MELRGKSNWKKYGREIPPAEGKYVCYTTEGKLMVLDYVLLTEENFAKFNIPVFYKDMIRPGRSIFAKKDDDIDCYEVLDFSVMYWLEVEAFEKPSRKVELDLRKVLTKFHDNLFKIRKGKIEGNCPWSEEELKVCVECFNGLIRSYNAHFYERFATFNGMVLKSEEEFAAFILTIAELAGVEDADGLLSEVLLV